MTALESGTPLPRVAVVAVHGVADQEPRASARTIADLLLSLWRDETGAYTRCGQENAYTPFHEVPIHVPVRPAIVIPELDLSAVGAPSPRPGLLRAAPTYHSRNSLVPVAGSHCATPSSSCRPCGPLSANGSLGGPHRSGAFNGRSAYAPAA